MWCCGAGSGEGPGTGAGTSGAGWMSWRLIGLRARITRAAPQQATLELLFFLLPRHETQTSCEDAAFANAPFVGCPQPHTRGEEPRLDDRATMHDSLGIDGHVLWQWRESCFREDPSIVAQGRPVARPHAKALHEA